MRHLPLLLPLLCLAACTNAPRYHATIYSNFASPSADAVAIVHGRVVVDDILNGHHQPEVWSSPTEKIALPLADLPLRTVYQVRAADEHLIASSASPSPQRDGNLAVWSDPTQPPSLLTIPSYSLIRPYDVCSPQIVGYANPVPYSKAPPLNAFLYTGHGFITLDPPGVNRCFVYATDGVHQFGSVIRLPGDKPYPVMWTSSPDSVVDLLPPGKTSGAVHGARGNFRVGDVDDHAALWLAPENTFFDLHPKGFLTSSASATNGALIVGYATLPATDPAAPRLHPAHAFVWIHRHPVDLHQFLPPSCTSSHATAIDAEGNILGDATINNKRTCFVWSPVPKSSWTPKERASH